MPPLGIFLMSLNNLKCFVWGEFKHGDSVMGMG